MACTKLHQAAMRSGRLEHRRLTHAAGGGRPPSACHAAAGTKSSSQQPSGPADLPIAPFASRRHLLLGLAAAAAALSPPALAAPASGGSQAAAAVRTLQASALEAAAAQAYADRDFDTALGALDELLSREPGSLRWQEMRAQARVDAKDFRGSLADFDAALAQVPPGAADVDRARLLAGRGLALEGVGDWAAARDTYTEALRTAQDAGQLPDPYVVNSRGNCQASLGEWAAARADFLDSAEGFQRASGYRYGRSTTPRLDGAIFASSNAALMLAQLGDEEGAMREMKAIARRAPGSVDMRAALAALYWRQGQESAAEVEYEFACTRITTGCLKYSDSDWLRRIRRWPPVMCEYMQDFLQLRTQGVELRSRPAAAPA